MTYVPGFEQDIFISYAQVDNQPMDYGDRRDFRWVTYLKDQLQKRIDGKLGRIGATKIWMDLDDLGGNESVPLAIDSALDKTAILVIVLSDGYLESEWCKKEIQTFVESTKADDRLFVVHLADIPLDKRPKEIRDLIGFNFVDKQLQGELNPSHDEYNFKLSKLRSKLAEKLKELHQIFDPTVGAGNGASLRPGIFLAEVAPDLADDREALAVYIEKLGYRVLPAKLYPRGAEEYQQLLDQDIEQAKLFVQLLGQFSTAHTDDFPEGYEGLQVNRARYAKVPLLRAYARGTVDFKKIRNDSYCQFLGASDVKALDIEEFKADIKKTIEELLLRESNPTTPEMGEKPVLIHVRKNDKAAAFHIRDRLKERALGYEIVVDEDESFVELVKIREYTGLVLVYGEQSPGIWIKQRMQTFRELVMSKQGGAPICVLYFDPPEKRDELLASPPPFFCTIDSGSGEIEFQQIIDKMMNAGGAS